MFITHTERTAPDRGRRALFDYIYGASLTHPQVNCEILRSIDSVMFHFHLSLHLTVKLIAKLPWIGAPPSSG